MTYPGETTYILSCPVVTLGSKSDWMVKLESQLEALIVVRMLISSRDIMRWHYLTPHSSAHWSPPDNFCFSIVVLVYKAGFLGGAQKKWKRKGKLSESYQLPWICLHFVILIAHKKRHILLSNLLQPSVQIVMTALSFPKINMSPCKRKLVGGFNPFEKYYSIWIISPGRGENKTYLKPPPRKKREHVIFQPSFCFRECSFPNFFSISFDVQTVVHLFLFVPLGSRLTERQMMMSKGCFFIN